MRVSNGMKLASVGLILFHGVVPNASAIDRYILVRNGNAVVNTRSEYKITAQGTTTDATDVNAIDDVDFDEAEFDIQDAVNDIAHGGGGGGGGQGGSLMGAADGANGSGGSATASDGADGAGGAPGVGGGKGGKKGTNGAVTSSAFSGGISSFSPDNQPLFSWNFAHENWVDLKASGGGGGGAGGSGAADYSYPFYGGFGGFGGGGQGGTSEALSRQSSWVENASATVILSPDAPAMTPLATVAHVTGTIGWQDLGTINASSYDLQWNRRIDITVNINQPGMAPDYSVNILGSGTGYILAMWLDTSSNTQMIYSTDPLDAAIGEIVIGYDDCTFPVAVGDGISIPGTVVTIVCGANSPVQSEVDASIDVQGGGGATGSAGDDRGDGAAGGNGGAGGIGPNNGSAGAAGGQAQSGDLVSNGTLEGGIGVSLEN